VRASSNTASLITAAPTTSDSPICSIHRGTPATGVEPASSSAAKTPQLAAVELRDRRQHDRRGGIVEGRQSREERLAEQQRGIDLDRVRERQSMLLLAERAEQVRRPRLGVERRVDTRRRLQDRPRDSDLLGERRLRRPLALAAVCHPSWMAARSASSFAATQDPDGRPRAAAVHRQIPQLAPVPATRAEHDSTQTHGRSSDGIAIGARSPQPITCPAKERPPPTESTSTLRYEWQQPHCHDPRRRSRQGGSARQRQPHSRGGSSKSGTRPGTAQSRAQLSSYTTAA
jgi:hypothetical protein